MRGCVKAFSPFKLPAQIAHSLPALWRGDALAFAPFAVFKADPPGGWLSGASAVFVGAKRRGLSRPVRQGERWAD